MKKKMQHSRKQKQFPMPHAAALAALPAAPTACPFTLARWYPPRRDLHSAMRASAGALARLAAGALSKPMAKAASGTLTLTPAVAVPRPRPLFSPSLSPRGGPGHRGYSSSAAAADASSSPASRGAADVQNAQGEDRKISDPRRRAPPSSLSFVAAPSPPSCMYSGEGPINDEERRQPEVVVRLAQLEETGNPTLQRLLVLKTSILLAGWMTPRPGFAGRSSGASFGPSPSRSWLVSLPSRRRQAVAAAADFFNQQQQWTCPHAVHIWPGS